MQGWPGKKAEWGGSGRWTEKAAQDRQGQPGEGPCVEGPLGQKCHRALWKGEEHCEPQDGDVALTVTAGSEQSFE